MRACSWAYYYAVGDTLITLAHNRSTTSAALPVGTIISWHYYSTAVQSVHIQYPMVFPGVRSFSRYSCTPGTPVLRVPWGTPVLYCTVRARILLDCREDTRLIVYISSANININFRNN